MIEMCFKFFTKNRNFKRIDDGFIKLYYKTEQEYEQITIIHDKKSPLEMRGCLIENTRNRITSS